MFGTKMDDADMVAGLRSGGIERRNAEKKLYERFFYFIREGEKKYALSNEDASSAYSDAIISVIHNIDSNHFEGNASIKTYAFQIFSNKCVDLLRKKTTIKERVHKTDVLEDLSFLLPDSARNAVEKLVIKNDKDMILKRLKELGEKCQQILLLFEEGYTDKEIGGIVGFNSADVAKTSRLRCLDKLIRKIKN